MLEKLKLFLFKRKSLHSDTLAQWLVSSGTIHETTYLKKRIFLK
jgi:hypothetical protein